VSSIDPDLEDRIDLLPPADLCFPVVVERTMRYVVMVDADSTQQAVDLVNDCSYEYIDNDSSPVDGWDEVGPAEPYELAAHLGRQIGPLDSCRECHGLAVDLTSTHVAHASTCSEYTHYLNLDKVYGVYPEVKGYAARCSCRLDGLDGQQVRPDEASALGLIEAHASSKKHSHRGLGAAARAGEAVATGGVL
jgi:hypothetical protein